MLRREDVLKTWSDLPIRYKVTAPFMVLILLTAIFAGMVARNWVAERIEVEMNTRLEENSVQFEEFISRQLSEISGKSRFIAETPEVERALNEKDLALARKYLIPKKVIMKLDFVAAIDLDGRVNLEINAPFKKGDDLKSVNAVKYGFLEMSSFDAIEFPDPYLIAVSPIHDGDGISGLVMCGLKINSEFLARFSGTRSVLALCRPGKEEIVSKRIKTRLCDVFFPGGKIEIKEPFRDFSLDDIAYRAYLTELKIKNTKLGVMVTASDARDVTRAKGIITFNVIFLNLIVIVLIGTIGFIVAGNMIMPASRLAAASRKVAAGRFDIELPVESRDEFGSLTEAFNTMTNSLRDKNDSLTKHILELTVLYDVSRMLGASFDVGAILSSMTQSALKVFNATVVCTVLMDKETGQLSSGICQKTHQADTHMISALEDKLSWLVREKKGSILIVGSDEAFELPKGIQSVMGAQMFSGDEVIGVINVGAIHETYNEDDKRLLSTLARQAGVAVQNASLFESLEETYIGIVKALAAAIDAKDPFTSGHSERVAKYALMMAEELHFGEKDHRALEMAAYLHDIGKIGIKDEILLKPAKLRVKEKEHIKQHPLIGANILEPVAFPWEIISVIQHHHEHYNGAGYPSGLKENQIPLGARILSVVDAFEAMTSERPYKKHKKTLKEAITELRRCSGTQFDPQLVEVFIKIIEDRGAGGI